MSTEERLEDLLDHATVQTYLERQATLHTYWESNLAQWDQRRWYGIDPDLGYATTFCYASFSTVLVFSKLWNILPHEVQIHVDTDILPSSYSEAKIWYVLNPYLNSERVYFHPKDIYLRYTDFVEIDKEQPEGYRSIYETMSHPEDSRRLVCLSYVCNRSFYLKRKGSKSH